MWWLQLVMNKMRGDETNEDGMQKKERRRRRAYPCFFSSTQNCSTKDQSVQQSHVLQPGELHHIKHLAS